jgi:myo-inositol-1(or 4)-monophosphatase
MVTATDLDRIREGLRIAGAILMKYSEEGFSTERKDERNDPVTEADLECDEALRTFLPQPGDGWLSEETADDDSRLACSRVWVVDPLDGTREFVEHIPEWCVSIGLVEAGEPVAGGIYNPKTEQMIVGAVGSGVTLNGERVTATDRGDLAGAVVLASRSEVKRGEWNRFEGENFTVKPTGSVAFKLGLVAVGEVDATWTLVPKSEWDVAAGMALIRAAGGEALGLNWKLPPLNQPRPKLTGLIASGAKLMGPIRELLSGPDGNAPQTPSSRS